ncbi:hypothetical protein RKD18_004545 [Streptomyces phaeoluteigriseus]
MTHDGRRAGLRRRHPAGGRLPGRGGRTAGDGGGVDPAAYTGRRSRSGASHGVSSAGSAVREPVPGHEVVAEAMVGFPSTTDEAEAPADGVRGYRGPGRRRAGTQDAVGPPRHACVLGRAGGSRTRVTQAGGGHGLRRREADTGYAGGSRTRLHSVTLPHPAARAKAVAAAEPVRSRCLARGRRAPPPCPPRHRLAGTRTAGPPGTGRGPYPPGPPRTGRARPVPPALPAQFSLRAWQAAAYLAVQMSAAL